ncbi:MAG: hypothetical protein NVS1B4_19630 [Gemmatimonadaceae bacterium]
MTDSPVTPVTDMFTNASLQAPAAPSPPGPSAATAGALPGAADAGAAPALSGRDHARAIRDEMRAIRDEARGVRREAMQGTSTVMVERPFGPTVREGRMIFTGVMVAILAVVVILHPIARAFARRLERGGRHVVGSSDNSERLQRIEQAVESIAIEVERISEAQRFTVKLMARRTDDASHQIAEGPTPTY